jgi:hypothetical protein
VRQQEGPAGSRQMIDSDPAGVTGQTVGSFDLAGAGRTILGENALVALAGLARAGGNSGQPLQAQDRNVLEAALKDDRRLFFGEPGVRNDRAPRVSLL